MEKWKLGVIGLLLLGLIGYGVTQQKSEATVNSPLPGANSASASNAGDGSAKTENKAAKFIGQTLGSDQFSEWSELGPWQNSSQAVTLNSLKGQPALIEFFRIGCSHCQEAAPFMEALYQRYQPRGLKMVAVQSPGDYKDPTNDETQWPKVQAWITAAGLTYPIAMDKDSAYFQGTLKGTYYPTILVSDASGKIVHGQTGHDAEKTMKLAVELEKLYPGPGAPKARAQSLMKFLLPFLYNNTTSDPAMEKALADDLEQRLTGKVKDA